MRPAANAVRMNNAMIAFIARIALITSVKTAEKPAPTARTNLFENDPAQIQMQLVPCLTELQSEFEFRFTVTLFLDFFHNALMHCFQHERNGDKDSGGEFLHVSQHILEPFAERHLRAAVRGEEQDDGALKSMVQGKKRNSAVFGRDLDDAHGRLDLENEVALAEHDALGNARGAGCEQQDAHLLRVVVDRLPELLARGGQFSPTVMERRKGQDAVLIFALVERIIAVDGDVTQSVEIDLFDMFFVDEQYAASGGFDNAVDVFCHQFLVDGDDAVAGADRRHICQNVLVSVVRNDADFLRYTPISSKALHSALSCSMYCVYVSS